MKETIEVWCKCCSQSAERPKHRIDRT